MIEKNCVPLNGKQSDLDNVTMRIALLGQPNAGKTTLFNTLTGLHQHVGNWPGKTVEQKSGEFSYQEKKYIITDLPGSYSLSSNSEEEIITRDFIASGKADLVCMVIDASQLERSLFMLADYVGITCPTFLVLNMIDIAEKQGKKIDTELLSKSLGITVISMNATSLKAYNSFYDALAKKNSIPDNTNLIRKYKDTFGETFSQVLRDIKTSGNFSAEWITSKILENDKSVLSKQNKNDFPVSTDTIIKIGSCKFEWIDEILTCCVKEVLNKKTFCMGKFDKIATSRIWGKPTALLILILGLVVSFIICIPWMAFAVWFQQTLFTHLKDWLIEINTIPWLISLIQTIFKALGTSIGIVGFVAGSSFVFTFLEDIGYMARASYVFNNMMTKLGLQGKSIMAFMMSFGCSVGGSVGTRVIDSWGQRMLTLAMAWMMPCAATWGVIAVFSAAFWGFNTIWIMLSLFATSIVMMYVLSKIFAPKLINKNEKYGLIMELPPYHAPKWGPILRFVFSRMGGFVKRAFTYIVGVNIIFWCLAYSSNGHIESSLLYKIGEAIEPITIWIGMRWEMFVAWLCSVISKEASLGVFSAILGTTSEVIGRGDVGPDLASQLSQSITKPEALGFIYAFYFNVPCFVAVFGLKEECHSWKWTLRIISFYISISLLLGAVAYYIGQLIY